MIRRGEYRGCLKDDLDKEVLNNKLEIACKNVEDFIREGKLLHVSLYRFQKMCFLYCEAEGSLPQPESFFSVLNPYLETWPEEEGKRYWASMYPVYYHSIPTEEKEWMEKRNNKKRIGRIAFLKGEKWSSYVYWHKALVEEGLFCGDKYQFISLHENILFSYYEEPKTIVNIRRSSKPSEIIGQWKNKNPKEHFIIEKTGGENFYIMEELMTIEKERANDF